MPPETADGHIGPVELPIQRFSEQRAGKTHPSFQSVLPNGPAQFVERLSPAAAHNAQVHVGRALFAGIINRHSPYQTVEPVPKTDIGHGNQMHFAANRIVFPADRNAFETDPVGYADRPLSENRA